MKLFFIPFSIVGGLLSGFLAKKIFEQAWGLVDDRDPPDAAAREASRGRVVLAAALEGAVARGTRALVDNQSRRAFMSLTGTWPGEDAAEQD